MGYAPKWRRIGTIIAPLVCPQSKGSQTSTTLAGTLKGKPMNRKTTLAALFAVALIVSPKVTMADPIHVGIAIDGSGSISDANFTLQRTGLSNAIGSVFGGLPDGTVRFTVVQFGSSGVVEVGPTLITAANLASVQNQILAITQNGGGTDFNAAINTTRIAMTGAPDYDLSDRAVINVSTDGQGVLSASTITNAVNAGIDEISAEAVGPGANVNFLRDNLAYPQPGVIAPPFAPGQGFVIQVSNFQEYEAALTQKLQFVVEGPIVPEPASMAVWTILLLTGAAAVWYRRRKLVPVLN